SGEYDFSTKGAAGTGYGLPAARDYVRSLGGELVYHNRSEDRGFVVQMFLDLFDKDRHIDETIKPRRSDP
ncbi:MAG TPA: ATP-binding protein, partial [Pyrinomonadaceae bacterium]|nr:ATP-binding protein [Pyrinomonadaceae bacterium]